MVMNAVDAEEYTQALGQVVAGGWRQVALGQRLGVPQALGLTTTAWVEQRLGGYVRMSLPERREAVKQLTAAVEDGGEGLSTRKAAEVLGVDNATVWHDQRAVENSTTQAELPTAEPMPGVENATDERPRLRKVRALAELTGTWPVIYADPPWRYEAAPTPSRAIENQYPTLPLEDICALPVSDKATAQAVLFLWATAPKVDEALQVIKAWGFTYRTHLVWDKVRMGMGYYGRVRHEDLLISNRGGMPTPETDALPDSIISAPRAEHSRKPDVFYELIEGLYPEVPYLELFARRRRTGWDVWGNEVDER